MPTVIKYSSQPSQQHHPKPLHGGKNKLNDTPVVIKYLQDYTSPNSKDSSLNSRKSETQAEPKSEELSLKSSKAIKTQMKTDDSRAGVPIAINESPKTSSERNCQNEPEGVDISERKINDVDSMGQRTVVQVKNHTLQT